MAARPRHVHVSITRHATSSLRLCHLNQPRLRLARPPQSVRPTHAMQRRATAASASVVQHATPMKIHVELPMPQHHEPTHSRHRPQPSCFVCRALSSSGAVSSRSPVRAKRGRQRSHGAWCMVYVSLGVEARAHAPTCTQSDSSPAISSKKRQWRTGLSSMSTSSSASSSAPAPGSRPASIRA